MNQASHAIALLFFVTAGAASCTNDKPIDRKLAKKAAVDCSLDVNTDKPACLAPAGDDDDGAAVTAPVAPGDDDDDATAAQVVPTKELLAGVNPLSDEEALAFLNDKCFSCHDAKNGKVRSFWPLDKDNLTKDKLAADAYAPRVFFSMVMKAKDLIGGKPSAMPPAKLNLETRATLLRMLKWMSVEMPAVVAEAKTQFGAGVKDGSLGVGVILDFKCTEPATFREYIRRFTNDVFGREPTPDELAATGKDPDEKATAKDRKMTVDRIFDDPSWKEEFEGKALKKFADKVSGAADIQAQENMISDAQAAGLKDEFFQVLKKNYETKSFKEILLSDKIMVNHDTAPLYGCTPPTSGWTECDMKAPRGSYFTSFSYLRSKATSFIRENNNYGRAALMHFFVRGDVFKAAFDQDGGSETVNPLPACLKTKDFRGKKTGTAIAWRGAAAVPSTANLCQSCHIDRQMAAGAILFRPYNIGGLVYGTDHPVETDPDFAQATDPLVVNKPNLTGTEAPVDKAFLDSLLTSADEKACVPANGGDAEVPLKTVKDLATFLIGDGDVLSAGLARHMPRALSNLQNTSEEVIIKVNKAFADGKGKIGPAFKAYLSSETYGCKR